MVESPRTYAALRSMSYDELVRLYDLKAEHVAIDLGIILGELRHRDQAKINRSMRNLTIVIACLTVVNTIFVIVSALNLYDRLTP